MKDVVFWGAAGQAKVLRECLEPSGIALVALFDNNPAQASPFADVPVFYGAAGFEAWRREYEAAHGDAEAAGFLVAIGGTRGRERMQWQGYLEAAGLSVLTAQHRTAWVASTASVGAGSQILAQAAVCAEATVGHGCIVNTAATVDHECVLEEGVHIAPGAHLGGCVVVERYATIGIGAVVLPRLRVGQGAIVGAGAVVTKDVPPGAVVVGNPARVIMKP